MLLITDLERGGTPLRIALLARGLAQAGLEVHVGCLAPPGPVGNELAQSGISVFACGATSPVDLRALWRLSRHVRRIRPDLIHATLTHANVAARLIGWLHNIPVIGSTATIEVERHWHCFLERLTVWADCAHVVNSQAVAAHVRRRFGLPAERVFLIPPSIDPAALQALPDEQVQQVRKNARRALGLSEGDFVVLWAGRLDPVKRVDLIVRCAELTSTDAQFLLAGDGPDRRRTERLIRESPAGPRLHLLGWREDLDQLMRAADVFLFPSRTEGMPNAVLRAMAAGLPVIASDIPAHRELAGQLPRMCLVSQASPDAFAAALSALRADASLRAELAGRAASWASANLDPAHAVAATIQLYRTVLSRRYCRV